MNKKMKMNLLEILSNSNLLNDKGCELTQDEVFQLWCFFKIISYPLRVTRFIRMDSDENLRAQFGTDTHNIELLSHFLFLTGEKGRICWNEKKYIAMDDTTPDNFKTICKRLKEDIQKGCQGNTSRAKRMRDFYQRNTTFCDSFNNMEKLIEDYCKLSTEEKKKVNLYYMAIAHTINSGKNRRVSNFVSTSTN